MPCHHGTGAGAAPLSSRPKWIWGTGPRSSPKEGTGDAICIRDGPEPPSGGLVGRPVAAGMALPAILAPPVSCPCSPSSGNRGDMVDDILSSHPICRRHWLHPPSTSTWSGVRPLFRLYPRDFPPLGISPSRNRPRGPPREAGLPLPSDLCLCPLQRHMAMVLGLIKVAMTQLHVSVECTPRGKYTSQAHSSHFRATKGHLGSCGCTY